MSKNTSSTASQTEMPDAEMHAYPSLLSRVSWGAIFAGTICAIATHIVLSLIGMSAGLAMIDPTQQQPLEGIGIGAGVWWTITSLIAFFVGGWIAARLAGLPRSMTGALHGITVWALVAFISITFAVVGVSRIVGGTASVAAEAGQTVQTVIPDSIPDAELSTEALNELLPGVDLDQRIQLLGAQERQQQAQRDIVQEARELVRRVISQQQQQAAAQAAEETAGDVLRTPGNAGRDLERLLERLFASESAVFGEEDRRELLSILQTEFNVSEQEAERIVERWQNIYQQAATEVQETWSEAQTQAAQLAQTAANSVAEASAWTAFGLILGLLSAAIGGMLGRPEEAAILWPISLPRFGR